MKVPKGMFLLTILIFLAMTLITMKSEAQFDGVGSYGFPPAFYEYFNGKCDNYHDQFGFKFFIF
ncbi:MAG: hypothetical protein ACJA2S_001879 [Cyclobacteriaceae bacterium]|jgi:hypothetical protein